jgi:hypothetical protein
LDLQQFARQSGNAGIRQSLTKKKIKSSTEIILHACIFMLYWAGVFNPKAQEAITEGANVMLTIAHRLLAQQKERVVVQDLPAP